MINLVNTSSSREIGESVLFQPVLKAYPTWHSWIITAHISLGHPECHWKYFSRPVDKTHQLLQYLSHQPAALTHLISTLQVELTNINDIYNSCKSTIISAINLLNTDPSFDGHVKSNSCLNTSLLPFLGNTPRWLTGTATTKMSIVLWNVWTNSLKLNHYNKKPWYILYPFLTSHDMKHK